MLEYGHRFANIPLIFKAGIFVEPFASLSELLQSCNFLATFALPFGDVDDFVPDLTFM